MRVCILGAARSGTTALYTLLQEVMLEVCEDGVDFIYEPFLWSTDCFNDRFENIKHHFKSMNAISIEGIYHHRNLPMLIQDPEKYKNNEYLQQLFQIQKVGRNQLVKFIRANGRYRVLKAIAPDAKFIFIIRNPADVLNSIAANFSFYGREFHKDDFPRFLTEVNETFQTDFARKDFATQTEKEAFYWLYMNRFALESFESAPGNPLLICYETLMRDRKACLERICGYLNVPVKQHFYDMFTTNVGPITYHRRISKDNLDLYDHYLETYMRLLTRHDIEFTFSKNDILKKYKVGKTSMPPGQELHGRTPLDLIRKISEGEEVIRQKDEELRRKDKEIRDKDHAIDLLRVTLREERHQHVPFFKKRLPLLSTVLTGRKPVVSERPKPFCAGMDHMGEAWHEVFEIIKPSLSNYSMGVVGFMESHISGITENDPCTDLPWIGIVHTPPDLPEHRLYTYPMGKLKQAADFEIPSWKKVRDQCLGLVALSEYHAAHLRDVTGKPVEAIRHPVPGGRTPWSWEAFAANPDKCIIQPDERLARPFAIHMLPETGYQKVWWRDEKLASADVVALEEMFLKNQHILFDFMKEGVIVDALPGIDIRQAALSKNIAFAHLYTNAIPSILMECLAGNTPILINPLPAVKEYLGDEYPLYYYSYEDAAQKAEDQALIKETHAYMDHLPLKKVLSIDSFLDQFHAFCDALGAHPKPGASKEDDLQHNADGSEYRNKIIYDVGMHIGQDTEFYLRKGFKVVAIEANPALVETAEKRFHRHISDGSLAIVNAGIVESDTDERLTFYVNDDLPEWSSFIKELATRNNSRYHEVDVPCRTLDSIIKEYGTPYYVKIDIEGHDKIALKSLENLTTRPKYVSVENGNNGMLDILISMGYNSFKYVQQNNVSGVRMPYPSREGRYIHHRFDPGASGPFGEESPGDWLSAASVRKEIAKVWNPETGEKNPAHKDDIHGWFDLHAKTENYQDDDPLKGIKNINQ